MITAAARPVPRHPQAKLLIVDSGGRIDHLPREALLNAVRPGDLLVANDAATLPASLQGRHAPSARAIEVRLAGRRSLAKNDIKEFAAIVFGEGDFHTRTEDRPAPPPLNRGDRLALGPLSATVLGTLGHPRLIQLAFDGTADAIWAGLARHGRPIQYAHVPEPLALWDVWTVFAGPPVAFEPPSAGFTLDWRLLALLRARRIQFATLTHAAGISSTGDEALDRQLPFDEPYDIPTVTAQLIEHTKQNGGRIVAVGTTVVRALEHAAGRDGHVRAGEGMADQRIGPSTVLRIVNVLLSGVHEPGTSHYELLRAFASDEILGRMLERMAVHGYRTHEFGDAVLIEAARSEPSSDISRIRAA
jgi:S-adenosylmethionine:tRNA ribosyltransferase-isomerase